MKPNKNTLLEINNLNISIAQNQSSKSLVKNISFQIKKNEIVGLIGGSGSGKSLTALTILNLLNKDKFKVTGEILFKGNDLLKISEKEMLKKQSLLLKVG